MASNWPGSLNPYQPYGQFNTSMGMGGRAVDGQLGSLLMMMLGNKVWPVTQPGTTQGQFDAMWQRQHSLQMQQVGRNAVSNSFFPLTNLGFTGNGVAGNIATSVLSQPNNPFANFLSPFLGGNPVLAQQSTFSNMQGFNMAGLNSGLRGLSVNQVGSAADIFNRKFYRYEPQSVEQYRQTISPLLRGAAKSIGINDPFTEGTMQDISKRGAALENVLATIKGKNAGDIVKQLTGAGGDIKLKPSAELTKAIQDAVKTGTLDAEQVNALRNASELSNNYQNATPREIIKGVNLKASMGFNYEDLTGGLNEAQRARLISGQNYNDINQMFMDPNRRQGSMVGAMDSMREFFGNDKSGKELMQMTSQFVGYSNMSLNNARELENVLRSLKSLARVANMDFEQIKGMVTAVTGMAQEGKYTSKFGGKESSDIVQQAIIRSGALANTMDSSNVRFFGGTDAMAQGRAEGSVISANQPISHTLAALYHQAGQRGDKATQARILAYGNGPSSQLTDVGFTQFLRTIPGGAQGAVQNAAQNATAAQLGFQEASSLKDVGGRAAFGALQENLIRTWGGRGSAQANTKLAQANAYLKNGNVKEFLAMLPNEYEGEFNEAWKHGYLDETMASLNPERYGNAADIAKRRDDQTKFDAQVSRDMAGMNASTITRLTQAVISGDVTKNGIGSIGEALGVSDTGKLFTDASSAQNTIESIKKGTSIDEAFGAGAGNFGQGTRDLLKMVAGRGISMNQLNRLKKGENGVLSAAQLKGLDVNKLLSLSTGSDLTNYSGDLEMDPLKDFAVHGQISGLIDQLPNVKDAYAGFNSEITKNVIDKYDAGAYALKGVAGNSADGVYGFLHDYAKEAPISKEGAGRHGYTIGGKHAQLIRNFFGNNGSLTYGSEEDAKKALDYYEGKLKNDTTISRAMQLGEAKDKTTEQIDAAKTEAENKDKAGETLEALIKVGEKISSAISKMSEVLGGGK